jgi:ketosteroid isomerase-like protein
MSNVDALKEGYEAFGHGDLEGAVQSFADDIRWENPEAPQIPNNGVTEGKEQVKQLFAELANCWDSFQITPELPWVHIWRFRDGQAVEVQALTDTALATDALGKF